MKILKKPFKTNKYYTGIYKPVNRHKYRGSELKKYRSSYERAFMIILDFDPTVEWWDFEWVKIPYQLDGKQRNYIPDFLVKYKDGYDNLPSKPVMVEVKPYDIAKKTMQMISDGYLKDQNAAKWVAAMDYCMQLGYIFSIKTEKSIFAKKQTNKK